MSHVLILMSLLKTKLCVVFDGVVGGYSFEPESQLVFTVYRRPTPTVLAGDVYEGQWKDDKANGEGVHRLNLVGHRGLHHARRLPPCRRLQAMRS